MTVLPALVATCRILSLARWDFTLLPVVLKAAEFNVVVLPAFLLSYHIMGLLGIVLVVRMLRARAISLVAARLSLASLVGFGLMFTSAVHVVLLSIVSTLALREVDPDKPTAWYVKLAFGAFGSVYAVLFFLRLMSNTNYWLPSEIIELKDNAGKHVVYVVESGDHDLTAIPVEWKDPLIIRQEDIARRTLCAWWQPTTAERIFRLPIVQLLQPEREQKMPPCFSA
ncbi:hypothetical protein [Actinokineospora fastidiosa]|uniref:hypothetical protein n=1 Tax=Actinokineospora fastidiosa TaxID=1816 RepID=UPI0016702BB5|nr:hypothetical protein [Actinokineospora fastidiosa]